MDALTAYCVKCGTEREIMDPVRVLMAVVGREQAVLKGVCTVCGESVFKIVTE